MLYFKFSDKKHANIYAEIWMSEEKKGEYELSFISIAMAWKSIWGYDLTDGTNWQNSFHPPKKSSQYLNIPSVFSMTLILFVCLPLMAMGRQTCSSYLYTVQWYFFSIFNYLFYLTFHLFLINANIIKWQIFTKCSPFGHPWPRELEWVCVFEQSISRSHVMQYGIC